MRYSIFLLLASFFALSASAADVTVTFTNLRSASGTLIIGIYDNAESFPKEGSQMKKIFLRVTDTKMTTTLQLPAGEYAFAICHDEDDDGTCNQNFLGIPTEGFAFSNNFRPRLRAPRFEDVKITVGEEDLKLKIGLIYF